MKFTTKSNDPQSEMPNKSTSRDHQQPHNKQITIINHNNHNNHSNHTHNHNHNQNQTSIPKPLSIETIQLQTQTPIPTPSNRQGTVPYDNQNKKKDTTHMDDSTHWTNGINESNEELKESKEDNNILSNISICNVMDKDLHDIMNSLSLEKEFSDIIRPINNPNPTKTKKKKRKKLRKGDKNNGISYNPNALYRAQGNIQISKQFTGNIIPLTIRENINNIYSYIDKCTAICLNINSNELDNDGNNCLENHNIRILNYNFHEKINNIPLYCVVQIQDINSNASRGYKWKMINKLYNNKELEFEFGITKSPKSFHDTIMFKSYKNDQTQIKNVLMNNKSIQQLIDNTPWHKTDIFNKVNNKRRMHLFLTKPEFMKQFRDFISCSNTIENEINLIPILMFNDNDLNEFWIEHIWVIEIDENISIGISLKYNNKTGVKVSGIHLDREYLIGQHELILPYHSCNCFHNFKSNINYLSIGNPDDSLNKIKYYKQQIDELTKYKLELQTLQKKTQITRSKSDNIKSTTPSNFNPNANVFVSQQQQQHSTNTPISIPTTQIHTQPMPTRYSYTLPPYDASLQRMGSGNRTPHSQMYGLNNTLNSPSNISYTSSYGANITNITPNYNRNMNINNNTYNK